MTTSDHQNTGRLKTPMAIYRAVERARDIILAGGLVAIPTETVYGLAADATNDKAVARIFAAKGRPQFNPLIIHVASVEMAQLHVEISPLAEKLMTEFWPGPLTLVLPRKKAASPLLPAQAGIQKDKDVDSRFRGNEREEISLLVSAGLDTIGVRMPQHVIAQALIRAAGRPLAAPSANRSGAISPTRAEHVRESLGDAVDMILDGGPCSVGVESTIVKFDGDIATLLRPGGIARAEIERCLGEAMSKSTGKIEAPGMMASHYAPNAAMRLDAREQRAGEAFLGFGAVAGSGPAALNLSASGDVVEAAANLFAHLRALDAMAATLDLRTIAVAPIQAEGLGEAINDRLARAAAPRR